MSPFDSLPSPKWLDAIDILLISFLIHRLLVLFRGTTTRQVSAVLVILWMLRELARASDLILTSRFLEALGTVAVLVIVVAFRDEIRDVLIQTNPARLFLGHPNHKTDSKRLNATVEATFRMAAERTGVLLVFQNRDRIGQHLRDGIQVGGQVSVPMLESIFSKESPVHDGAALIRGNKIERVGTILPLTQQADLPPEYGTRHRAAIGLSEVCDAAVVVASEERGEVSIVHRGAVTVVQTPIELERALQRLLGWDVDGKRAQALRREFLRQVGGFCLTALAIATYWVIFYGQEGTVTNVTVPIDFRNLPEGLEISRSSSEKLEIQVRGQRPLIDDLKQRPEQVIASVDLHDLRPGEDQTILLSEENIELPVGLEVVRLSPTSLTVDLFRRMSKRVPVRARIRSVLPRGTGVGVEPESVVLVGPESALRDITEVLTEPMDLGPLIPQQLQVMRTVKLEALPDSVRLGENQPQQVRVIVQRPPPEPSSPAPTETRGAPPSREGTDGPTRPPEAH